MKRIICYIVLFLSVIANVPSPAAQAAASSTANNGDKELSEGRVGFHEVDPIEVPLR